MKTRVAWVDTEGNIVAMFAPENGSLDAPGIEDYNGLTPHWIGPTITMEDHYWNGTDFVDKPVRPGEYYDWVSAAWALNSDVLMSHIRLGRDIKLQISDWRVMPDSPLTEEKKAEWVTYRQALRDVPENNTGLTHLDDVTWPGEPS
tara:strand:+ start:2493 stop:2930 length:438 start_codon:yes stop_codon:yes gene_type:complete